MSTNEIANETSTASCVMLGTAGHIDHGKSTLIRALTGTDPDRLAEEKERGITIQLGFARLDLPDGRRMGVVDVPGHERFVRQMIAGATGIDLALLCIAADDGIMPQTVEHLAVLQLLGVPSCVVALTKTDLVDDEWIALVADEVREALRDTPYAGADIVPVSSKTGSGLDELKAALARNAARCTRARGSAARMPVDRAFSIKGAGTVVTGTLWDGSVRVDDELELLPRGIRCRVRSIQMHGADAACAQAGNRVALNLGGLKTSDVRAGDFLAAPGAAHASDRFDAQITYLGLGRGADKPLETGTRVHVAHGTREVTGRVLFMNGRQALGVKESALAQIRLDAPLPVSHGARFVIRSYSPVAVIAGGSVIADSPRRRTTLAPVEQDLLEALRDEDIPRACKAALALQHHAATPRRIASDAGIATPLLDEGLRALAARSDTATLADGAALAAKSTLARDLSALENALLRFHAEHPLQTGISKAALHAQSFARMEDVCFDALVAEAERTRRAVHTGGLISHPQAAGGARAAEEQARADLLQAFAREGAAPAAADDVVARSGVDAALGKKALHALEKEGSIVRVDKTLCFAKSAYDAFERSVRALLERTGSATASELKDAMGTSRKYAMPLLEFMDERGVTVRDGDTRRLR